MNRRLLLLLCCCGALCAACMQTEATPLPATPAGGGPPAAFQPATSLPALGGETPILAQPATGGQTRIQFQAGTTAAHVSDRAIAANGIDDYVLEVMAGQVMTVAITPFNAQEAANFALAIYSTTDGALLPGESPAANTWTGALPATQDYLIRVINYGNASRYSLQIVIPSRITFAAGATAASVEGAIAGPPYTTIYILEAMAGQAMSVAVTTTTPGGGIWLGISGADGTPLLRGQSGLTSWTGFLPATQDYVLQIGAVNTTTLDITPLGFTLTISITG